MTDKEKEVFEQETSEDELEAANGGVLGFKPPVQKSIYEGGFPNCAATVEDGSWCNTNDACLAGSVQYLGMKECLISWK